MLDQGLAVCVYLRICHACVHVYVRVYMMSVAICSTSACMYLCVAYVHGHAYVHVNLYVCTCAQIYSCAGMYFVLECVCAFVSVHVHVKGMCRCACEYVSVYVYAYV